MRKITLLAILTAFALLSGGIVAASGKPEASGKNEVKLTYVYWGSTAEDVAVKAALKDFMAANPGIKVEGMYLPGDLDGSTYNTKMKSMAASGTLPDVGYFRPEEFGNYAEKDFFLQLDDRIKRDGMDSSYLSQTWLTIGGKTFGAYTAAECQVMFYNKKVLNDAGVTLPPTQYDEAWSWDEFVANLKKITVDKNGKHPGEAGFDPKNITRYGVVYDLWSAMYYPTIWSNGGGVISDDGKTVLVDTPETIQAVQRLGDLINKDHVMPYMGGGSGLPAPSVMLANSQLGFWVTGQWALLEIGAIKDLPFDVAALPIQKKPAQIYLSGVNVVFKSSKHPEEAWLLQKWMMDPSKTLNLYTSGLWMPTKASYYSDPANLKEWTDNAVHPAGFKGAVLDSMKIAKTEPVKIRNINQIWGDYLNPAFESIWIGQSSAEKALKDAADKIRKSGLLTGTY